MSVSEERLIELETRPNLPEPFRSRVIGVRTRMMERLAAAQADWHGWTPRNAGRLAEARRIVAEQHLPAWGGDLLDCAPPQPPAPAPIQEMNTADERQANGTTAGENLPIPETVPLTGNKVR